MIEIRCAVIYGKSSDQHQYFMKAGEKYFDTVLGVPLEHIKMVYDDGVRLMYKNTDLCEFDCVLVRLFTKDILYGEQIAEILDDSGVYTQLDTDSLDIAHNKFYSMKVLSECELPIPETGYTLSTKETERIAKDIGYPVVIKLISGYGGKGVMKADSNSDLKPIIDTLELFEQDICLQEYIENPGEDIRIIVVGDDTYSYKRVGGSEEWRSNISAGGSREKVEPSDEMKEAAVMAAKLCGFEFAGVDIIEGDDGGFYIGEINPSPGVGGTEEVLGVDVADRVMEHLYNKTVEVKSEIGV
ncbi:MAG: RimK family alpha-L-glutamate ligase [Candidatus Nanohaloarchaea archaeon]|nr:RimK family alpha-L-glutamate ligase [Candidatus Nanohaloarchaea archaeon]